MQIKCWTGTTIEKLESDHIFVFGSNPEGRHGLGAARAALKFGAKYGVGRGLCGQTYALVTKNLTPGYKAPDGRLYPHAGPRSISPDDIKENILELYQTAQSNPSLKFIVCYQNTSYNLNGYSPIEIIDMFLSHGFVPDNIYFHSSFRNYINFKDSQNG